MEVVYEGILELGYNVNNRSSRDWKPYLFVLKYDPFKKRSVLDYYKNTKKRWQKQSTKGSIPLPESFELSLAHQCAYKYTLRLDVFEKVHYLACNSQQSMNKLFHCIQTQQIMVPSKDHLIFNVTAEDSSSMSVIGVSGNCQLVLTTNYELHCVLLPKKQIAAVWPFQCLRSYSYGNGMFSIEAGRHSPHGPGEFSFITAQDKLIHDQLERLINKFKRSSSSSESSSRFSVSDRPPAKLPDEYQESSSESPVSSSSSDLDPDRTDNARMGYRMDPENTFEMSIGVENQFAVSRPPPVRGMPPKLPPKGLSQRASGDFNKAEWFNRRFGHALNGERQAPVGSESSEDHVYSHTLHRALSGPQSLSPTSTDDPMLYNSLVRDGAPSLASPTAKDEKMAYEVAYPRQVPIHIPNYDIAYTKDRPGLAAKGTKDQAGLSPPRPPKIGDDGTTPNPLYGSQRGSFLEDHMNSLHRSPPCSLQQASGPPVSHELKAVPDVTANPVYVTSTIGVEQKNKLPVSQPVIAPPTASVMIAPGEPLPQQDSSKVKQAAPDISSSGGKVYTPEKDFQGYTKISKTSVSPVPQILERDEDSDPHNSSGNSNSGESHPVSSSLESDPPQVPERFYDSDC